MDTADLFRLYRNEWVIVHTVSGEAEDAYPFVNQAQQYTNTQLPGVLPGLVQLEAHTDNAGHFWVHVKLLKPNLKGEFKYEHLARRHAEKQGWPETEIVTRDSTRDHELRTYGAARQQ